MNQTKAQSEVSAFLAEPFGSLHTNQILRFMRGDH